MAATISGSGTSTLIDLTTSGNTTLGDATTDTLTVGVTGIVKDASGNVGIGTSSPSARVDNTGTFRSTGATDPSSGTGLELSYRSTYGDVLAYNRTSSAFVQLQVRGEPIIFGNSGGERMRIDSSGNLLVNTTTAQTGAKLAVTGGIQGTIQSGTAVASTSGTSIDFTGIPSWVKRITVMFQGVSTNGTSFTQIQLGTGSTTYTTSGYVGGAYNGGGTAFSAGFIFSQAGSAVDTRSGIATITNITGNAWAISGAVGVGGGGGSLFGGAITLSATLTAIRITTVNGTDTFDAGSINIMYEG